jgi:hypothetical protein
VALQFLRRQRIGCGLGLWLVVLGLAAGPASAQQRTGSTSDPRDQPSNLSGPNRPDIAGVGVIYNPNGTLTLRVTLYQSVYDTQSGYSFHLSVGSSYGADYDYGDCLSDKTGDAALSGSIDPTESTPMELTVVGYEGTLTPTRTISADGGRVDFTTSSGALANRDYRCGTESELSPYGYPSYGSYGDDTAAQFSLNGYEPPPAPACSDGIDNEGDGLTDWEEDYDCDGPSGTSEGQPPGECEDGRDNDGDGYVDYEDDECYEFDTEAAPPPKCRNGVDDDDDGFIDQSDIGCISRGPDGNSEKDLPACSDGIDNDSDGRTDMRDRACVRRRQATEVRRPPLPRLSRGAARRYTKVALRRKFRAAWIYRCCGGVVACQPRGRVRQRCRVAFGIGDTGFVGKVRIRYRWHRKDVYWYRSMNILRIDEYCLAVRERNRSRCTKRIRVG